MGIELLLRVLALALIGQFIAIAQSLQDSVELGPKDGKQLPPADLNRVKVGDEAPDFSLEDQDGRVVTLSSFRGKKAVVLVFYRGKW
jgi:cytochrome oxidase Cu insertion factor (SCO1/SenC/PrrC family)